MIYINAIVKIIGSDNKSLAYLDLLQMLNTDGVRGWRWVSKCSPANS